MGASDYRSLALVAVPALSWRSRCRRHAGLSLIVLGVTLAGCDLGPGQFGVDPGRYEFYHCNDLATRLKELQKRESVHSLMAKAREGGGGTVMGSSRTALTTRWR